MERVTSTKQLRRGQRVIFIVSGADMRVTYYRFISEDLSNNQAMKEHYGYFADLGDWPSRFYLAEREGSEIYTNYTDEDIIRMRKAVLEKSLKMVTESFKYLFETKGQNTEEQ